MKRMLMPIILIFILLPPHLSAQVQMVTRPERESVELTIYNNEDLTLVREQRKVTLKSGLNLLQFSWADTLVDPMSVQLRVVDGGEGVHIRSAILPSPLPGPIEEWTQWQVEVESPGERTLEVSYFTSGLTWSASYVAVMDKTEKSMSLSGSVTISNDSGDDYENAQTRLVVGEVKLLQDIRTLAGYKAYVPEDAAAKRVAARKAPAAGGELAGVRAPLALAVPVAEMQAVSEYYMYVLKGRDTIKHQWRKRKLSFTTDEIPVRTVHRFGEHGESVVRFYQFKNDEEHKLGKEPLPKGKVDVFVMDESGAISAYVGQANMDFTPIGKEVKLQMYADPEVRVKKRQMDIKRVNLQFNKDKQLVRFDTEREYTFEVENYKAGTVNLEIRENLGRDWTISSSSHKYEQKDVHSIEFKLELPPGAKDTVRYHVRLEGR